MTIRMLQAWNGLPEQLVTTLSGGEESRLVGLGLASFDLDGPADNVRMAQIATDAGGNVFGMVVNTIADLKALSAGQFLSVQVLGYYAAGDGGGDIFRWNSTSTAADNGGTVIIPNSAPGTGRWERVYQAIDVKKFGAKGDGITDDTAAIQACFTFLKTVGGGTLFLPKGVYTLVGDVVWNALSNISFVSDGKESTILKITTGSLYIKSPTNVSFDGVTFSGNSLPVTQQTVWVSNYNGIAFKKCNFKNFGTNSGTKPGSCCLHLLARDVTDSFTAAGNSSDALIDGCTFEGGSRKTNFAVRVFTEFTVAETSTNTGVIITNSTVNEFNWNAVEIAGPNTSNVIVSNCVANLCGLTPFDLDKGCHDCIISDVNINRLLGNADSAAYAARITAVNVQGVDASTYYAYNNLVDGVTVNFLASDLADFNGALAQGAAFVSLAYARNNVIKNIVARCDSVPTLSVAGKPALACVFSTTASGNVVSDVLCVNAAEGVIYDYHDAAIGSVFNEFRNIKNIGTLAREAVVVRADTLAPRNKFENLNFISSLSSSYVSANNSLVHLSGTSTVAMVVIENSYLITTTAGKFGVDFKIPRIALNRVEIDIPDEVNFFATGLTGIRLHFGSNTWRGNAVNVANAFANLIATTVTYQNTAADWERGAWGTNANPSVMWVSSATPTTGLHVHGSKIFKNAPIAGDFIGWVCTTAGAPGTWKTFGTIAV